MGKPFLPQADTSGTDGASDEGAAFDLPQLTVSSPAFVAGEELPAEFTGDGGGQSPPVAWTAGPPGTQSYALNLWHVPDNGNVKSYWLLYDIPADVTSLPENAQGIGTVGFNDKGRQEYEPMKSKGPGAKQYRITVYALSEKPKFVSAKVNRNDLLNSISDITLAAGTLNYQYTRSRGGSSLIIPGLIMSLIVVVGLWFGYRK